MTALNLFYSYAHEDENFLDRLTDHLSQLKREGLINQWHDRQIRPGALWAQDIDKNLRNARIILLLVSASFLSSDYCMGTEMTIALERHKAGEATVIPIILRDCDWEHSPLGQLQALPTNAKPVTLWKPRDSAFKNIAKGIRAEIAKIQNPTPEPDNDNSPTTRKSARSREREAATDDEDGRSEHMPRTPTNLNQTSLKKAVARYAEELKGYQAVADYELGLRAAFQNLLNDLAKPVRWSLVPEMTIGKIRPDGVLIDEFKIRRGYWEAKGPNTNLEDEITRKIKTGYPLTNTIFEDSKQAVLFQGKRRVPMNYDLRNPNQIKDLLNDFFSYTEPDIENFEAAVDEFKERIPEHARALLEIIQEEHKLNKRFQIAFAAFAEVCRASLDPRMTDSTIDEMLAQHLLTERLFRTVFNNPDFVRRNAIAAEIEKVIDAMTSRKYFNRAGFLQTLDRFYVAIERAAKGIESWSERQEFLNTVYERFFQGFSTKQADVHGIVYTPQEIVDFMVESVDEVLKKEFGKSIATPGVKILDPATGTGNFIANIIQKIDDFHLEKKYKEDLFCNEIMLLPYYIASLNIEHQYFDRMGQYEPFEGICFADTLELAEGQQMSLFVEENTERVKREKDADIMVVIGNPPYNVGQVNENDNNKNRKYPIIDVRVRETYGKASKASNKIALSDVYVKFFRWAADRLQGRNGIVCMVTNNSFVDQITFDGMRKHLLQDFTQIYHLDLHGNVRKNPKLSGTTHNIFGIQVGVGITVAIRNNKSAQHFLKYYRVPESWRRTEKTYFLQLRKSISGIEWINLQPDERNTWITEGLRLEFSNFLSMGNKISKTSNNISVKTLFKTYSAGITTSRDNVVYDFNRNALIRRIKQFSENYNAEISRWVRQGSPEDIDAFVQYDKIKWSRNLKRDLKNQREIKFNEGNIIKATYRPFTHKWLYFSDIIIAEQGTNKEHFPVNNSNYHENFVIWLKVGSEWPMFPLAIDAVADFLPQGGSQCFPFYTYSEDGSNRRENITDWALKQFGEKYGPQVTKWDIFHYIYAMLHHPEYRDLYKENLKRDLPHIPLLLRSEAFEFCVRIGRELMDLHVNYEEKDAYELEMIPDREIPFQERLRVEKMKLTPDKRDLIYSKGLTLAGIPQECFEYRLGNRSALEWIIDQYQVSVDKRSGIESDPNDLDDPQYILRLIGQVITVSVRTVELVKELAVEVTSADWLGEIGEVARE